MNEKRILFTKKNKFKNKRGGREKTKKKIKIEKTHFHVYTKENKKTSEVKKTIILKIKIKRNNILKQKIKHKIKTNLKQI